MRQGQWNRLSDAGKYVAGFMQDMEGVLLYTYLQHLNPKQRRALNTMARRGIVRQQKDGNVVFTSNLPYSKTATCDFVSPFGGDHV